jgi:hypothetical protein
MRLYRQVGCLGSLLVRFTIHYIKKRVPYRAIFSESRPTRRLGQRSLPVTRDELAYTVYLLGYWVALGSDNHYVVDSFEYLSRFKPFKGANSPVLCEGLTTHHSSLLNLSSTPLLNLPQAQ